MSQPAPQEPATADPPVTGDEAVDAAVRGLPELADRPLGDHHDLLVRAHEALHVELSRDAAGTGAAPRS